ncbi:hypothetical protein ABK040_016876 [Willaertia magna]
MFPYQQNNPLGNSNASHSNVSNQTHPSCVFSPRQQQIIDAVAQSRQGVEKSKIASILQRTNFDIPAAWKIIDLEYPTNKTASTTVNNNGNYSGTNSINSPSTSSFNPQSQQFSNMYVNPYLKEDNNMSQQQNNNYQQRFFNNNSPISGGNNYGIGCSSSQPHFHNPQFINQPNNHYNFNNSPNHYPQQKPYQLNNNGLPGNNGNNSGLLSPFQSFVPPQQIHPPINLQPSKMVAGINNVIKEEKKKEFTPITKKTPCKDWDKCQKTSDEKHVEKHFHPCKFGTNCKHQENEVHINRYLHPCPNGDNCKKLKNEEHCTFFIHSKESKPVTSLFSYPGEADICMSALTCKKKDDRFHMVSLRHVCSKGENCTETDNAEHKRYFLHPCKYKENCRHKENKAHARNFIHPCKDGCKCKKYLEGEMPHIILKSHVVGDTSTLEVFNWPKEWTSPAPPKLGKDPLQKPHYAKVTVVSGTTEYQAVESLFKATLPSNTIQSIQRIENYKLWFWFCQKRKKMGNNCNEKKLFHGTKPNIIDLISKDGLDSRVSGTGKFGSPKYMFVVRALVGDTYNIAGNAIQQGLKRPPAKSSNSKDLYDSVTGCNGYEVMFYNNNQVYPEYLITYQ